MLNFYAQDKKFEKQNKHLEYSINDFIFRLKKLEKVCQKEELDAILLINGIDSRENTEYTKLTNWLFIGFSGLQIEQNSFLDEIYKELIFLIRKNGKISIFVDPPLFKHIHWLF